MISNYILQTCEDGKVRPTCYECTDSCDKCAFSKQCLLSHINDCSRCEWLEECFDTIWSERPIRKESPKEPEGCGGNCRCEKPASDCENCPIINGIYKLIAKYISEK